MSNPLPPATERHLLEERTVRTPDESITFAKALARRLSPGTVLAFYGELGSGKTFLVKQLCRFLETEEEATSPSFTIINEYHGRNDLLVYHFDFYRLEHPAELQNLGLDEYFFSDNICMIEWADKIMPYLPPDRLEIVIEFLEGRPDSRRITLYRVGASG